ncbi:predicted protein [Naegleria gruberi]|uniref:Predicted protein n=1 Tax=Naegleria gruberi TaxID=5762 RepID=D2VIM5_NAEGR|nr:uncharacterized protein NAEGRDRAFT_49849 [Naegleria gruberi]EFC43296.1 predicted protein [Naegleria gruberi]|eukprot:XP_002676040.1 predicted protein [Naegleria gruberi strain NEG-M]
MSDSSSDSDDDLFSHKNAKSVLDVSWSDISKKKDPVPKVKDKKPKKKKNLLDLVEDEEEEKPKEKEKKEDVLDVDLILAKNELYNKKARRNTSSSSEGKKKRKQDDEEFIKKQLAEQQKLEKERKRKKQKQMEIIHKNDEDVIDLDSEVVEELPPVSLPSPVTSPLLMKKPMMSFPSKPTVVKPTKAIDFKIQLMASDAFQKLEAAESFTFDDLEDDSVQEELSEAERKKIEAQVQREIEQLNKKKELAPITTEDVEEVEDEDKGEKITISIRWNDKTISVNIHERDKFQKLKKTVAKKFEVHPDQISFKFDGATLDLNSTPEDQAMESDDIIDCIVDLKKKVSTVSHTPATEKEPKENKGEKIVLEVRGNGKSISINFYKGEKFSKLAKGVAKQFSVAPEKIKLMFDGLALDLNETPGDQDMENEDIIDCKFL